MGEISLGEMGLGEMGLGEMGQNHQVLSGDILCVMSRIRRYFYVLHFTWALSQMLTAEGLRTTGSGKDRHV